MNGTVSNILPVKKYGFISGENGQEYFFHRDDLDGNWEDLHYAFSRKGGGILRVQFDAEKTPKGPRARRVEVLDELD